MTEPELGREIAFSREKAKRTLAVLTLALLSVIAMYLPLPKRFVAFLPLAVALVLCVRLLRFLSMRSVREKVWPAVTLVLLGMLTSSLLLQIAFYGPVRDYEACLSDAQTAVARADCEQLRESGPLGLIVR